MYPSNHLTSGPDPGIHQRSVSYDPQSIQIARDQVLAGQRVASDGGMRQGPEQRTYYTPNSGARPPSYDSRNYNVDPRGLVTDPEPLSSNLRANNPNQRNLSIDQRNQIINQRNQMIDPRAQVHERGPPLPHKIPNDSAYGEPYFPVQDDSTFVFFTPDRTSTPLKVQSLTVNTLGTQAFSFSEHNDLIQEFQVSPLKDIAPEIPAVSPPKVYGRSFLESMERAKAEDLHRRFTVRENAHYEHETQPPRPVGHHRNGSASLTVLTALATSTLTTASTSNSKNKRFVRYAMNNLAKASAAAQTNVWEMAIVLRWLEIHGFNLSWTDTFRRNEISGNRFLELCNYPPDLVIWRQFSKFLRLDNDNNTVERFIDLLRYETEFSDGVHAHLRASSDSLASPIPVIGGSGNSSSNSNSATSIATPVGTSSNVKMENRKSNPILTKVPSATPDPSPSLAKPRPYSYVDPVPYKNAPKDSPSHKFLRKHYRQLSSESRETPTTALSNSPAAQLPKKPTQNSRSTSTSLNDEYNGSGSSSSKGSPLLKTTLSLQNVPSASSGPPEITPGSRRSGIFNTFRKFGGDKAVEIVKQVGSSSASMVSSQKGHSSKNNGPKAPTKYLQGYPARESLTPSYYAVAQAIQRLSLDHPGTPESAIPEELGPLTPLELPPPPSPTTQEDAIDSKYLPVLGSTVAGTRYILVSKDNQLFVPVSFTTDEIADVGAVKNKIILVLGLIDIGLISFHLTDFGAMKGIALTDDVFFRVLFGALGDDGCLKLCVHQELLSPLVHTFSTTSSDSKSFEYVGDNSGERMYPVTPQYLLQQDAKVDYLSFKDTLRNDKLNRIHETPAQQAHFPLKLPFSSRREAAQKLLPQINTSEAAERTPSFKVLRKEGREIDFDKRRNSPYEAKPPKLIPNIYSSSVSNSLRSPVSATTVQTFRDNARDLVAKSISPTPSMTTSEKERMTNIVAKRAPPPPPSIKLRSNSLLIARKPPVDPLPAASTNSEELSFSSKSSSSDRSFSLRRGLSITKSTSLSRRSTITKDTNAFKENDISFANVPALVCNSSDSDDDFFVKPARADKDDEDEFFMKPVSGPNSARTPLESSPVPLDGSKTLLDPKTLSGSTSRDKLAGDLVKRVTLTDTSAHTIMSVRPPVEEVYENLEKYFPNTDLDKPIIDDTPANAEEVRNSTESAQPLRTLTISRTFSSANISPVNPQMDPGDEVFYAENSGLLLSRGRMKTIRVVANEARRKRQIGSTGRRNPGKTVVPDLSKSTGQLHRTNTKMWGQKVVEVTSKEIEKGVVSKIRSSDGTFAEFAWIKGELIGRGSFGSVYLALNVTTGEMLAVKQVRVARNTEGIDAFYKEVETMKDLNHLNIVQYLGFEQNKTTCSLFLEYVAGGSISMCMKLFGRFEEPLIRFITRQILLGLEYLHSNGILHRDLKADNLLLEMDGTCKILDFGISKKSQDIYANNAEMSMQGTVFWMAPEVIDSIVEDKKQGYSAKIDIWSLGCVVLEMFAGRRPWSNEAVVSAIYKIGKTKLAPPIPADVMAVVSVDARNFIDKCFTIDSNQRPTARELLKHDFLRADVSFAFENTRVGQMIRYNARRAMKKA